jgi:hypothetical protein
MGEEIDLEGELNELLAALGEIEGSSLVHDIRTILSSGKLVESEVSRGRKEEVRRLYTASEAYCIAVEMVLAAINPALMIHEARRSLHTRMELPVDFLWHHDNLEGLTEADSVGSHGLLNQLASLTEAEVAFLRTSTTELSDILDSLHKE